VQFENTVVQFENTVVVQFENTPKAFANFSPGLERKRQPWVSNSKFTLNPERVRRLANPYRVCREIKIRKKQGMKNHSSSSKNSLQGKYAQEIF